uniref:Uncharacterized protein n=1 Tax=Photinus pyralis TaxID=7054 RepID=A0A1Y1NPV8_PHOPY
MVMWPRYAQINCILFTHLEYKVRLLQPLYIGDVTQWFMSTRSSTVTYMNLFSNEVIHTHVVPSKWPVDAVFNRQASVLLCVLNHFKSEVHVTPRRPVDTNCCLVNKNIARKKR